MVRAVVAVAVVEGDVVVRVVVPVTAIGNGDGPVVPDQCLPYRVIRLFSVISQIEDIPQVQPVGVVRGRLVGFRPIGQTVLGDRPRPARQGRRRLEIISFLSQDIGGGRRGKDVSGPTRKPLPWLHVGEPGQVHLREVRGSAEPLREIRRLGRPDGGEAPAGSKGALISYRRHPPLRAEVVGHGQRRIAAVRSPAQEAGVVRPIQVREVHGGRNVTRRPLAGGTGGTVSSPRGSLPPVQELRGEECALPPGKRPARAAEHPAQNNKPTHSSQSCFLLFLFAPRKSLKIS